MVFDDWHSVIMPDISVTKSTFVEPYFICTICYGRQTSGTQKSVELTRDIVDLGSLAKLVKQKGAIQVGIMKNSHFVDTI